MKLLLETLKGEKPERTPVWLMRQAGRYLPEYRELREKTKDFLTFCYTPELAAEATLQPIRRFGFDAAIVFSDILVVPHALGMEISFLEREGPVLTPLKKEAKPELSLSRLQEFLSPVYQAVKLVSASLPQETTLIGFAGAPWTLACYMLEGKSSRNFENARTCAITERKFFGTLMDMLTEAVISHLSCQIEAGAEAVQIFDSWAGILPPLQFDAWVIEPAKKIIAELKKKYPQVPVIGFPRGAGQRYEKYMHQTKIDGVSVDETIEIASLRGKGAVLQGNLDNVTLKSDKEEAIRTTRAIMESMRGYPHIFNLGHGILPQTPLENVEAVLYSIREFHP